MDVHVTELAESGTVDPPAVFVHGLLTWGRRQEPERVNAALDTLWDIV